MLDASRASQLLKTNWKSVSGFAQELYSIVTSKEPKVLEAPLTIRVPEGKTALRIVSGPTRVTEPRGTPAPRPRPPRALPAPATNEPPPPKPDTHDPPSRRPNAFRNNPSVNLTVGSDENRFTRISGLESPESPRGRRPTPVRPAPARDESGDGFTALSPITAPPSPTPSLPTPTQRPSEPDSPGPMPAGLIEPTERTFHQPSEEPPPSRPVPRPRFSASEEVRQYAVPHRHPIVEIEGPVSFSGGTPVQFDSPPLVLNRRTKQYEPIGDYYEPDETPTHIPRAHPNYDPMIGKYKSGSGQSWVVTIYPDGKPPTSGTGSNPDNTFDVTLTVLNAPNAYKPNANEWLGPITQIPNPAGKPDDDYYYFLAGFPGKYAQVQSPGITAASGATLGSGTITLCSRNAAALTANGGTATCYNAGGAISTGKFISVVDVDGDWSTSVAPC